MRYPLTDFLMLHEAIIASMQTKLVNNSSGALMPS